jgi:hypothetical protein
MPITRNFYFDKFRCIDSTGKTLTSNNGILNLKVDYFINMDEIKKISSDRIALVKDNTFAQFEWAANFLHDHRTVKEGNLYKFEIYDPENMYLKTAFHAVITGLDKVVPLEDKMQLYYFSGAKISICEQDTIQIFANFIKKVYGIYNFKNSNFSKTYLYNVDQFRVFAENIVDVLEDIHIYDMTENEDGIVDISTTPYFEPIVFAGEVLKYAPDLVNKYT